MTPSAVAQLEQPPEVLASDLCWLLTRANQRQKAEFDQALLTTGLTPRKHQVLATADGESHTQTELARIVGLDKTTMMVTLDELEADGLAERRPLPRDRRARIVAVTPAGRRVLRRAEAAFEAANESVLSVIPATERAAFLSALARLACGGACDAADSATD